jgi:hypothetical protein
VIAIDDRVGGHTDPGRAGVRSSVGESSSWSGQTTATGERFPSIPMEPVSLRSGGS